MFAMVEFVTDRAWSQTLSGSMPYRAPAFIDGESNAYTLSIWLPNVVRSTARETNFHLVKVQPFVEGIFKSGSKFEIRENGIDTIIRGKIVP